VHIPWTTTRRPRHPSDPDDDDRLTWNPDEAIWLAEQAIRDGNPEGHLDQGPRPGLGKCWSALDGSCAEYSTGLEKLG